jgi:hypothetical protein
MSRNSVARLLCSHGELSHDWAEVDGLLHRLGPVWAELRSILNELNAVRGAAAAGRGHLQIRILLVSRWGVWARAGGTVRVEA